MLRRSFLLSPPEAKLSSFREGTRGCTLAPPLSLVTEAYRMLRATILISQARESPKTILFTSGIYGEGKTVTVP
jgi:Mrp family chromosome partitioning ATPase